MVRRNAGSIVSQLVFVPESTQFCMTLQLVVAALQDPAHPSDFPVYGLQSRARSLCGATAISAGMLNCNSQLNIPMHFNQSLGSENASIQGLRDSKPRPTFDRFHHCLWTSICCPAGCSSSTGVWPFRSSPLMVLFSTPQKWNCMLQ